MSKSSFRLRVALRSSLWIVPTLLVLAAVAMAAGLLLLDTWLDTRIVNRWPWLVDLSAEGARSILTAVAGSMITVAGVVFSITVVVLSLAASQYTSRVLRNFMSDRATQVVLGVFVGVFGYCLVVLGQVQSGNEPFVPTLGILGGIALAFVAIAFLIFFIHHIATLIQASEILARAADETLHAIDEMFPEDVGEPADDADMDKGVSGIRPVEEWRPIPSSQTGYIQTVDANALLAFAVRHDTVLRMECGIGQFAISGAPLVSVPASFAIDATAIAEINDCYAIDHQRTIEQDPAFGLRQLTDIALRALSPGINDTTTAVMALDYSTAILARLARRKVPSHLRLVDGKLRLIACGPDFADLVAEALMQIRQNAAGNVAALMAMFHSLQTLEGLTLHPSRRRVLLHHTAATLEIVQRTIATPQERKELEAVGQRILACLSSQEPHQDPSQRAAHTFVGSTIRDHAEARS